MKRSPMKRTGRLKPRSKKMSEKYIDRRKLVGEMLSAFPTCQAQVQGVCRNVSVDIHELLARSQGGSILDKENCLAVCRMCHSWIGDNPAEATILGLRRRRYGNG